MINVEFRVWNVGEGLLFKCNLEAYLCINKYVSIFINW